MQKILFFEGVDKTGKSNIAKCLSEIISAPYFKNTTEKLFFTDKTITKYRWLDQLYLYEFLKQTGYSVIIDRGFISDLVYTRIFRKKNKETIEKLIIVDKLFASIGAKIIYCYKTKNTFVDDVIDIDKYSSLSNEYDRFLKLSFCEILKLDTTDMNIDSQINKITEFVYKT